MNVLVQHQEREGSNEPIRLWKSNKEDKGDNLVQHQEGEGSNKTFRLWKSKEEDKLANLVQHQEKGGSNEPFGILKGSKEDELLLRKGPQYMPTSQGALSRTLLQLPHSPHELEYQYELPVEEGA